MSRRPILPLGTPDEPRAPAPIEPIDSARPGPLGDRPELALIALLGLALVIRGCWPW